jgi:transcriptional regulator with XRE-family HTH domain
MMDNNFEKEVSQLGQTVRKIRVARGLTQEDIVKLTDIARSSLVDIEKGKRSVMSVNFFRLCVALEVSPVQFMKIALHDWEYTVKKIEE